MSRGCFLIREDRTRTAVEHLAVGNLQGLGIEVLAGLRERTPGTFA